MPQQTEVRSAASAKSLRARGGRTLHGAEVEEIFAGSVIRHHREDVAMHICGLAETLEVGGGPLSPAPFVLFELRALSGVHLVDLPHRSLGENVGKPPVGRLGQNLVLMLLGHELEVGHVLRLPPIHLGPVLALHRAVSRCAARMPLPNSP